MKRTVALLFLMLLLPGCAPSGGAHKPVAPASGSGSGGPNVDYTKVKPIFSNYCAACHPARSKPDWLDYQQAKEFAQNGMLRWRVWQQRSMPPPGSSQAASISEADRSTLAQWAQSGAPETSESAGAGMPSGPAPSSSGPTGFIQECLQCHGLTQGEAEAHPNVPILVGQSATYLTFQLQNFKWRNRIDPSNQMNGIAAALTHEQIQQATEFFAKRPLMTKLVDGKSSALFETGKQAADRVGCISCHMNPANQRQPISLRIPILRGQSRQYLINQLIYYRTHERINAVMEDVASNLTNSDIEAVADFFSLSAATPEPNSTSAF